MRMKKKITRQREKPRIGFGPFYMAMLDVMSEWLWFFIL